MRTPAVAFWISCSLVDYRDLWTHRYNSPVYWRWMDQFFQILLRHKSLNPWYVLQVIIDWFCNRLYIAVQIEVWIHTFFIISGEAERWLLIVRPLFDWRRFSDIQFFHLHFCHPFAHQNRLQNRTLGNTKYHFNLLCYVIRYRHKVFSALQVGFKPV